MNMKENDLLDEIKTYIGSHGLSHVMYTLSGLCDEIAEEMMQDDEVSYNEFADAAETLTDLGGRIRV